jgi:hypothetical protein
MNFKNKGGTKMKSQKLLVIVVSVCLLVGAPGAAMAENNCPGEYLAGNIEDDVVVLSGTSCVIQDATVTGDITASEALDVAVVNTKVSGNIKIIDGESATVYISSAKNIRLRRNAVAVAFNSLANRNLVVSRNGLARVKQNGAVRSIICRGNLDLDASRNSTEGEEDCRE